MLILELLEVGGAVPPLDGQFWLQSDFFASPPPPHPNFVPGIDWDQKF